MAYYIKRVCPKGHFYVAKLDPEPQRAEIGGRGERITFSLDLAAEVRRQLLLIATSVINGVAY